LIGPINSHNYDYYLQHGIVSENKKVIEHTLYPDEIRPEYSIFFSGSTTELVGLIAGFTFHATGEGIYIVEVDT
jgi:hypothetical protein